MTFETLIDAYNRASQCWTGCHWQTCFGPRRLNLMGITASQAKLLVNATAGEESRAWREAADWLQEVEHDAVEAERAAQAAVFFARNGLLKDALYSAEVACELESNYPTSPIWETFRHALRAYVAEHKPREVASAPTMTGVALERR